jgi:16S rRNA U516 pseudouridylate synthase RsuA-like enzyme
MASEWADLNQIDGRRTVSLRTHLRTNLEQMGFVSGDKPVTKEDKKRELLIILRSGKPRSLRKTAKALGYKSHETVLYLLRELMQEGFVSNKTGKWSDWTVNEVEN